MAVRIPLVLVSGQIAELPAADTIPPGPSGPPTLTQVEVSLGSVGQYGGSFTIAGVGMTIGKPVMIQQAKAAYTGKGSLTDESAMDQVQVTGVVTSATVISCDWTSGSPVLGNFKFNYLVGA